MPWNVSLVPSSIEGSADHITNLASKKRKASAVEVEVTSNIGNAMPDEVEEQVEDENTKKMREQSKVVSHALEDAELPDVVKNMLVTQAVHSLSTFSDQRHRYQTKMVEMAREALREIEGRLMNHVAAAKAKVDSFDRPKAQSAIPEAAHRLAELRGVAAVKQAEIFSYEMKMTQAKEAWHANFETADAANFETAYDTATAELDEAKARAEKAEKEVSDGEDALKLAQENLESFDTNLEVAQATLKDAEEKLAEFRNGPLEALHYTAESKTPLETTLAPAAAAAETMTETHDVAATVEAAETMKEE
jgi:chromosome segregation ATPase